MDGSLEVRILGDLYPVRAKVHSLDSFSGHADHDELISYFRRTGGPRSKVYLVHGERTCSAAMKEALTAFHDGEVHIARLNTVVSC